MALFSIELLYAIVLMLGSLSFGYTLAYPSPVIPEMKNKWPDQISEFEYTIFNSISSAFAIAGPFVSNLLLRFFTRRVTVFITAIVSAIFWGLVTITRPSIFWLGIVIRCFSGIAMGMYSSVIPLYLVEIAPQDVSGFFGSLNQLGVALGIVICYLVGNWCNYLVVAFVCAGICGLQAILIWFIKDSPCSLQNDAKENKNHESIFQKQYIKNLIVGVSLMFFQQFSGVNAILTNLNTLFTNAGVTLDAGIASAIAALPQIIAVFIGGLLIDKFGRRAIWIVSSTGLLLALILYALTLKVSMGSVTPIIAIFIFMLFFGLGAGPIPWFLVPELFPDSVRSTASSICSASNWVCAFLVITIYPYLAKGMTDFGTMILFACICLGSVIFGVFCVKEPHDVSNYEAI